MAGDAAIAAGDFIAATFIDPRTGGFFASASPDARHLPKPIKQREDNVTATRFFTLLAAYSGEARYREIAEAGMGYLASPAVLEAYAFLPDVLLAEEELRNEPVHVTVVGAKDDPRSAALYAGALAYPLAYKRAEWWDKREGKLVNPDVDYPDYPDGPAAFACTRNFCSLPVTDAAAIPAQLDRLQRAMRNEFRYTGDDRKAGSPGTLPDSPLDRRPQARRGRHAQRQAQGRDRAADRAAAQGAGRQQLADAAGPAHSGRPSPSS